MTSDGTFAVCLETIKPQLDHSDPSYQAALDRCHRAAVGETAHQDDILQPFGGPWQHQGPAPVLPDPPGAQRRAQNARPTKPRKPRASPLRDLAFALLAEHGRPATAEDIAPGDARISKTLQNARNAGKIESRTIVFPANRGKGGWRVLYALPGMEWQELPPGVRYIDSSQ